MVGLTRPLGRHLLLGYDSRPRWEQVGSKPMAAGCFAQLTVSPASILPPLPKFLRQPGGHTQYHVMSESHRNTRPQQNAAAGASSSASCPCGTGLKGPCARAGPQKARDQLVARTPEAQAWRATPMSVADAPLLRRPLICCLRSNPLWHRPGGREGAMR